MPLFENRSFVSHAGLVLPFKIDCDVLSDEDIETAACIIGKKFVFSKVHGIPRGGVRLANALEKYISPTGPLLIVDDVFTTGKSMAEAKRVFGQEDAVGVVIFARGSHPAWIKSIFQLADWVV